MKSARNNPVDQWQCCQPQDLKAGDILLFRPSKKRYPIQKFIMFCQTLLDKKHGHYDTVHAGICTGNNPVGEPMLAHITVVANQPNHYRHEPLQTMLDREEGDRPFLGYRPVNPALAQNLSRQAIEANALGKIHWSITSAARGIVYCPRIFSHKKKVIKPVSTNTFCSQFVVEVMKKASGENYPELNNHSSPKALESYLSKQAGFQKLCYLGKEPYHELLEIIHQQITRLSMQHSETAKDKYQRLKEKFNQCLNVTVKRTDWNEVDKMIYVLNEMLVLFKDNTGGNWRTPTSYQALSQFARNRGIFKHANVVDTSPLAKKEPTLDPLVRYNTF